MSADEFAVLCEELGILPAIALESDAVVAALQSRDDEAVRTVLEGEF